MKFRGMVRRMSSVSGVPPVVEPEAVPVECVCAESYVRDRVRRDGRAAVRHSVACDLRFASLRSRQLRAKIDRAFAGLSR